MSTQDTKPRKIKIFLKPGEATAHLKATEKAASDKLEKDYRQALNEQHIEYLKKQALDKKFPANKSLGGGKKSLGGGKKSMRGGKKRKTRRRKTRRRKTRRRKR